MAKILPIKIFSCPILRQKSRDLTSAELKSKEIQRLISDMQKTMSVKDGAGLAAPQVGHNIKVIVISTKDGAIVLVNPKILRKSWKKELQEEGCLSLPEVFGLVKRSVKVNVVGLDAAGKMMKFKASGYFARVLQHEIDHLDGTLFIDKAIKITQGEERLEQMKKKT